VLLAGRFHSTTAFAGELEELGYSDEKPVETFTGARLPRPVSQIAENVTVITADDIARINAHTLSDVLQTVPGIQLDYQRTPGALTFFNVEGAISSTVLVLIDGVRQNDFGMNAAWPGQIPVQMIDRIEIIKGSASTVYGPALGGVVNIMTKSPDPDRKVAGMVSGSVGSRLTADNRAELSGTVDRFGYYLNVGNLYSDGLQPNSATNQSNVYTKFSYLLPSEGKLILGIWHLNSHIGLDDSDARSWNPGWGFTRDSNKWERSFGSLSFSQPLNSHLTLDLDGYLFSREDSALQTSRDDQNVVFWAQNLRTAEHTRGGSARVTWRDGGAALVAGAEYGHVWANTADLISATLIDNNEWDSWATYLNGAYTFGRFTLLPGIRFDSTGIRGDNTSYTLGATYQLTGDTTLRAYAGKGFSLPIPLVPQLERVKTVQAGIESGALPYFWLKGTYFYNAERDDTVANDQNRQGFEIEARTVQVYGFSLSGGYTYQHAEYADTGVNQLSGNNVRAGQVVHTDSNNSVPPHLAKLALKYDNNDLGLRATLLGNWLFWNGPDYPTSDKGTIWDLHLNWKVFPQQEFSPELFFSGHNLFNVDQSSFRVLYPSAARWCEGGVRLRF
jgi:vitamin B12 transporter